MGPLLVSLMVAPAFAEVGTPFTLTVRIENVSKEPQPALLMVDDACLVVRQLGGVLTSPAGKEQAATDCASAEQTSVTIAPESTFSRKVELAKVFPRVKWTVGRWKLDVSWKHASADGGAHVSQTSLTGEALIRAKALQTFTIKPKGSITLSDGSVFTFRAHGHKHVMAGDRSPLIIRGEFAPGGKKREEFDASLDVEAERVFDLDGRVFELVDWKYDESIKLRYFGRVQRDFDD